MFEESYDNKAKSSNGLVSALNIRKGGTKDKALVIEDPDDDLNSFGEYGFSDSNPPIAVNSKDQQIWSDEEDSESDALVPVATLRRMHEGADSEELPFININLWSTVRQL